MKEMSYPMIKKRYKRDKDTSPAIFSLEASQNAEYYSKSEMPQFATDINCKKHCNCINCGTTMIRPDNMKDEVWERILLCDLQCLEDHSIRRRELDYRL